MLILKTCKNCISWQITVAIIMSQNHDKPLPPFDPARFRHYRPADNRHPIRAVGGNAVSRMDSQVCSGRMTTMPRGAFSRREETT